MSEVLDIALTRRTLKALERLVEELHVQGLESIELHHVVGHLAAVTAWQQGFDDLVDLCARTGWPLPESSGPNHTTPAAWAAQKAKRAVQEAMLADSLAGASANEIAMRAGGVFSRPTALNVLAGERLLHEAVRALAPWFRREVPLHILPGPADRRRTLALSATWEGESEAVRRELLEGVGEALSTIGLAMRDPETKVACSVDALLHGDRAEVELYRASDPGQSF